MDQKMKIGFRVKENALLNVLIDDYYRYWPSSQTICVHCAVSCVSVGDFSGAFLGEWW